MLLWNHFHQLSPDGLHFIRDLSWAYQLPFSCLAWESCSPSTSQVLLLLQHTIWNVEFAEGWLYYNRKWSAPAMSFLFPGLLKFSKVNPGHFVILIRYYIAPWHHSYYLSWVKMNNEMIKELSRISIFKLPAWNLHVQDLSKSIWSKKKMALDVVAKCPDNVILEVWPEWYHRIDPIHGNHSMNHHNQYMK